MSGYLGVVKQRADVVYFFEHAARELDVACAVACLLQERGIRTSVVQWPHGFHRVSAHGAPAVVALPFCYNERSFAGCLLDWRTSAYFNLSWEQLFYAGNEKAKSPTGAFALKHVIHHSWSDYYAAWLQERGVPSDNIFVNGHPAYALYREPYRAYFTTRDELAQQHGLDADKRWIFFPENYNWAFYSAETLQRFIDSGQSRAQIEEMKHFCDSSLRQTLEWCRQLAGNAGVEIIIRPRPATPLPQFRSFVEEVLGELPRNMHLIQAGTVREWVLASDVVISSHSTTLIEAAVAGKPHFMLAPEPMPAALAVDWHQKVRKIRTGAELVQVAMQPERDLAENPLRKWAEAKLLSRGDPIVGLAERLAMLARGEVAAPAPVSRRDAMLPPGRFRLPAPILFEARRTLRKNLRRRPIERVAPEYLPDLAGEREVESRVAKWRDLLVPEVTTGK